MTARTLTTLALAAGLALPAAAFSPGPPRPIPAGITGVCSDGQPPADSSSTCGLNFNPCNPGAVCLVDPKVDSILATARGVLTLIVDEDVAGFLANTDTSPNRLDNARLTLLLELTHDGTPVALAETFQLDRTGDGSCSPDTSESSLCVPSWAQPLTEANLIAKVGEIEDLNLQWAQVNTNITNALRSALLTPAQLTAHPTAPVLLEVVDGVRDGFGAITADQVARLDEFDHSGPGDGLASVRRFKVTIEVVAP